MSERYMCVYYYQKPNGKWDEVTEFKNHLRMKQMQTAKVILDFKEKKCVKNGLNPEAGFDDMLEFYKRLLGDKLTPYLPQVDQESL
jgi:hypothetical protein